MIMKYKVPSIMHFRPFSWCFAKLFVWIVIIYQGTYYFENCQKSTKYFYLVAVRKTDSFNEYSASDFAAMIWCPQVLNRPLLYSSLFLFSPKERRFIFQIACTLNHLSCCNREKNENIRYKAEIIYDSRKPHRISYSFKIVCSHLKKRSGIT